MVKMAIPQQFIVNGRFELYEFIDYLQTKGSIISLEYESERDDEKSFINWWKNIIDITKWYLK